MLSPEDSQNLTGLSAPKKRTHRGRRGRGQGPKHGESSDPFHGEAKNHLMKAHGAKTAQEATKHLFNALTSLKRSTRASGSVPSAGNAVQGVTSGTPGPVNDPAMSNSIDYAC